MWFKTIEPISRFRLQYGKQHKDCFFLSKSFIWKFVSVYLFIGIQLCCDYLSIPENLHSWPLSFSVCKLVITYNQCDSRYQEYMKYRGFSPLPNYMRDLNSPPIFYSKTKIDFFSVLPIIYTYTHSSFVYQIVWGNRFLMHLSIIFAAKLFSSKDWNSFKFYSLTPTFFLCVVTILLSHYFTGSPAVI